MKKVLTALLCTIILSSTLAQGQDVEKQQADSSFVVSWDAKAKKQSVGQTTFHYTEYNAKPIKDLPETDQNLFRLAQACAEIMTDSLIFSSESKGLRYQRIIRSYLIAEDYYFSNGTHPLLTETRDKFDISRVRWETEDRGGGYWICLDETLLAGPTRHITSPISSLQVGLEAFAGHSAGMLDLTIGGGLLTGYYDNLSVLSETGRLVPYVSLSGYYSYRIPLPKQSVLSVFSGVGYSSLGLKSLGRSDWKSQYHGLTVSEGVSIDFFSGRRTVDFRDSRHVCSRGGVRVKLYSSQILLLPQNCIVPTLNLGLGYVFSSRNVRPLYD